MLSKKNLLINPNFEEGKDFPGNWETFSQQRESVHFIWEDKRSNSGNRCAAIEIQGNATGVWQQIVQAEENIVYEYSAFVAFEDVDPVKGNCRLQLEFLDNENKIIKQVKFPYHVKTRQFEFDFPHILKTRSPKNTKKIKAVLLLKGSGKAWFDDVILAPAPTGGISGCVTSGGKPISDARVFFCNDQWGKKCEAYTDAAGKYTISGMPVTFPRYIVMAQKKGWKTKVIGDLQINADEYTNVDFEMEEGKDPKDNFRIKFGSLTSVKFGKLTVISDNTVIPKHLSGYPEKVHEYLKADDYIDPYHSEIQALANKLLESVPKEQRFNTKKVSFAIHEWICKNIDHDGVFHIQDDKDGLNSAIKDETSGIWQTISGDGDGPGWSWGRNFYDWCYKPHEVLKVSCAICVEQAWLCCALHRNLNIPARASVGSYEIYVQKSVDDGCWVHQSTTGGRTNYRENGNIYVGFDGGNPQEVRFSTTSKPLLHEDWNIKNKILWREHHPWGEKYVYTPKGFDVAVSHLKTFSLTGKAPTLHNLESTEGKQDDQRALAVQDSHSVKQENLEEYEIHYSDITLNLLNIGDQRTVDVRFPTVTETETVKFLGNTGYWTNHPECIKRTWIEKQENPPVVGIEQWIHFEVDISTLIE